MNLGYVDTSCLVAVAFGEPGAKKLSALLSSFDRLLSVNLLEAEYRAALVREGVEGGDTLLSAITWFLPDRPLSKEIREVLGLGHVRGAGLFHLAAAVRLRAELPALAFLTVDDRQGVIARALGFPGPGPARSLRR